MWSYCHTPKKSANSFSTIQDKIKEHADKEHGRVAIMMCYRRYRRYERSRGEIFEHSTKFALALMKLGLKKGEKVAYCSENRPDWLSFDVGIMKAGCIPVHLRFGALDIRTVLDDCDAVCFEAKRSWEDFLTIAKVSPGGKVDCKKYPKLRLAIATNEETLPLDSHVLLAETLMDEFDPYSPNNQFPYVDPEDIAFISHVPAEVDLPERLNAQTHFTCVNCPSYLHDSYDEEDVRFDSGCMADPAYYPFAYIQKGCKCVNGDKVFLNDPRSFSVNIEIWAEEHCSIISIIPEFVARLEDFGFRAPVVQCSASTLTKEVVKNAFKFADKVSTFYDNAEALRVAHKVITPANLDEYQKGMFGRACEGVELKIVNDQGETCLFGVMGKICVRSRWATKTREGCVGKPLANGWFQTTYEGHMLPNGDVIRKLLAA